MRVMKWRLIKQALRPLKAQNPHKAGLLEPDSNHVYEPRGGKTGWNVDMEKNKWVCVISEN